MALRSFTNTTGTSVFVLVVHGETCSEILADGDGVVAFGEWSDAASVGVDLEDGSDVEEIGPGETLDLDLGWCV